MSSLDNSLASADLVIVFGARSVLSLVGIALIIVGVWRADRTWDELGSSAYERAAAAAAAAAAPPPSAAAAAKRSSNSKSESASLLGVEIPQEDLDKAFPFPWIFLLGWTIFGLSYFYPIDGSEGYEVMPANIVAAIVCIAIGWIASVPMGDAVRYRNAAKKTRLGIMFVFSWLALVVVSGWGQLGGLHAVFRAAGAISIIASMKILWKFRKMGDSWEQDAKPNPNPVVYNMGGPLFVFGWFLFWVGMAASDTSHELGLPIYFTARSLLAFVTGCGMVPVVLVVDYSHDEGAEFTGFGTDGTYFGRFLESPIPFLSFWTLFGVASWLPLGSGPLTPRQWLIFFNCVAQGIVAGLFIQTALYKGDLAGKTRWSIPFVLLFLALAIEIGYGNPLALGLSLPGAVFVIAGQKTVFGDRKRGDYWMETKEVNPNPIVYSYGEPLFMLGWLAMSLAMAIPM